MIYSNKHLKLLLENHLRRDILLLPNPPRLHIIQIGNDLASTKYVNRKKIMGQKLGVEVVIHSHEVDAKIVDLENLVDRIVDRKEPLIVQLPIPLKFRNLLQRLQPDVDVDLLQPSTCLWDMGMLPPTIMAIDLVIKDVKTSLNEQSFEDSLRQMHDLSGLIFGVIGQGQLVGSPLLKYLQQRNATIISINKSTLDPMKLIKFADIVVSAAGSPGLVDNLWLAPGSTVIDASTSESGTGIVGDVLKDQIDESVLVCPSPGGIGPLTVLCLFYNVYRLSLAKNEQSIHSS